MEIPRHMRLVIIGLEMKAARDGLTWAERIAHRDLILRAERIKSTDSLPVQNIPTHN